MSSKMPPAEIITAMDEFSLAVREHERAPIGADNDAALITARNKLDAAILRHTHDRSHAVSGRPPSSNRTLGWLLRMLLSSAVLEVAYWLAPAAAAETCAAMVEAGHAMRRDSDLPARQIA